MRVIGICRLVLISGYNIASVSIEQCRAITVHLHSCSLLTVLIIDVQISMYVTDRYRHEAIGNEWCKGGGRGGGKEGWTDGRKWQGRNGGT